VASVVTACASHNQPLATRDATIVHRVPASPFDTTSPNMNAARVIAGCYTVAIGAWSDERAPGRFVEIPSRIELDTARNGRRWPGFELVAHTPATGKDWSGRDQPPAWSPVGADSLQVLAWHNGTSALHLFLRRQAARKLEGTARYFWDQIFLDSVTNRWLWEQYPTAPVTLTAVPCA
jgi:hypothetical protein